MLFVRMVLKCLMWLIYSLFAIMILYFPIVELAGYFARETRLFSAPREVSIQDALLPLLALALIYAVVARLSRRIEHRATAKESFISVKER